MKKYDFRAWNPLTKKMSYDVTLYANGWTECVYNNGISIKHDPTELIVMQWTGKTDIEGTKVFDGDIFKDEFDRIHRVYWKDEDCKFVFKTNKQKTEYNMHIDHIHIKVIGNIYENKELIK